MDARVSEAVLRRPFTRTLTTPLRPLHILELSFADVQQRWHALIAEADCSHNKSDGGRTSASSTGRARAALVAAEKVSSQLKGIKQELVVYLSRQQHADPMHISGEKNTGAAAAANPRKGGLTAAAGGRVGEGEEDAPADPATLAFFTSLATAMTDTAPVQAAASSTLVPGNAPTAGSVKELSRRVWLWSVLMGVSLADMDLLSGSLSYMYNDLLPMPAPFLPSSSSSSSPSSVGVPTDRRGCAEGCVAQHGGGVAVKAGPAQTKTGSASESGSSELSSFFLPPSSGTVPVGRLLDDLFVAACFLLYSVLTEDAPTAARAFNAWQERVEASLAALNASSSSGDGSGAAEGEDGEDTDDASTTVVLLADRCVSVLAAELASGDYGVAGKVLAAAYGDAVRTSTNPNSTTEDEAPQTQTVKGVWLSFLLGLQLLLRMLSELSTRRALLRQQIGRSYRPIIEASEGATAASAATTAAGGSSGSFMAHCLSCAAETAATISSHGTWPRRIQRQRLLDIGGPWPLPEDLVRGCFCFFLTAGGHDALAE